MIYVAELMGGEHDGHVMEVDGWRDEILMPQRMPVIAPGYVPEESDVNTAEPHMPYLHYRIAIAINGRPIRSLERYVYRLIGSAP